ncbi:hypothetical protein J7384_17225 [Endozoicomonas sp. G2_1]|uniref:hypothetical protein n=1 Tax=Endozoicomonas sp. G2_1 TaxID=2821091 RepID=UPI001ADBB98C|nr:hypothetical protein [Endozoicomonas sp. G2_1]MBO9492107.1 hypothetical protein [Endozoicomonas sp. G2_1]
MNDKIKAWCEHTDSQKGWEIDGVIYLAHKLMFHWALLIDPDPFGYSDRYCFASLELIEKAIEEFKRDGVLRYWHKYHTKNHIVRGNLVFNQADFPYKPEDALYSVDFEIDKSLN